MATSLPLLALLVSAIACSATAQPPAQGQDAPTGVGIKVSFRPSIAIVVGIFTMIFSLTFLLLMYAKFCHPSSTPLLPTQAPPPPQVQVQPTAGVSKPVIESLPFFRFAALRGARQGLECAVCLSRFDDADLLRLLPRCHHAFHLDCVDRWLETSASCPLCRTRVEPDDDADLGLKYAASARFVFGGDDSTSGRDLMAGIFVERVASSRFPVDDEEEKEEEQRQSRTAAHEYLDRHKHRIIVSDAVFKSRWSDLNSADLIALDTEMLRSMSSGRFPPPPISFPSPSGGDDDDAHELFTKEEEEEEPKREDIEKKRLLATSVVKCGSSEAVDAVAARMVSSGARSMSEIVRLPRVRAAARTEEEERARRRWVPIARRTARWLARREEAVETADASSYSCSYPSRL